MQCLKFYVQSTVSVRKLERTRVLYIKAPIHAHICFVYKPSSQFCMTFIVLDNPHSTFIWCLLTAGVDTNSQERNYNA